MKPLDEVRRLRAALADKTREAVELRGLVNRHLALEAEDHARELERAQDVSRRDYQDGFTLAHGVGLGVNEGARPFVAGIRAGFDAGFRDWQETAKEAFSHLHQRQAEVDDEYEIGE